MWQLEQALSSKARRMANLLLPDLLLMTLAARQYILPKMATEQ